VFQAEEALRLMVRFPVPMGKVGWLGFEMGVRDGALRMDVMDLVVVDEWMLEGRILT
jgi:hypothetical protein